MPFVKHKPMPHEKTERNEELYRYRLEHKITFEDLGKKFEISGTAAHRLFKRMEKKMGEGKGEI